MIECGAACKAALEDRKFLMTIGAGMVNTGLFILHLLTESAYVTLTLSTVGAFIVANGVSEFIDRSRGNTNADN